MIYIKIEEEKYPCKIQTFTTQFGKEAIRIIGDVPTAENGFLIVDDEDNVISYRSDYTYLYREDDACKEYTAEAEDIIPTECFAMGDVPISPIQRQINSLNQRVTSITPYEQTKKAYYGEIEKIFYGVPDGNISVYFSNNPAAYDIIRVEDRVTIRFTSRLTDNTDITIMVQ